jgi:hypothetical protein
VQQGTDPIGSALYFVPFVSSSLASGDLGKSSVSDHFTNKSGYSELAAYQFVCSVPN